MSFSFMELSCLQLRLYNFVCATWPWYFHCNARCTRNTKEDFVICSLYDASIGMVNEIC
uniref:Uncharacterized protein n=1 Tax=Picea glauca TaxID=3330 RepID=A0A101M1S7_PICGL|nr:hypothetical protein ABT39_MTgene3886 [Picea glauca]QHR86525.1 hypothetical protein Q903MT_gene527 [Picea sitchensis]